MFKEEYEGFAPIGTGAGIGCEEITNEEEWV